MIRQQGLTLLELLVTLTILSIMAAMALPYAEMTITRSKEMELRRSLRDVRSAIDRFHEDWRYSRIARTAEGVSEDGYPEVLAVLVNGIERTGDKGDKSVYLRRIPRDPFAGSDLPANEHWRLRGYQDAPDSNIWNAADVYDVRSKSERTAIDGSLYQEW